MTYPYTPEWLKKAPERAKRRLQSVEDFMLCYIAATIKNADFETLKCWKRAGYSDEKMKRKLSELTGAARAEIERTFKEALKQGRDYYTELYRAAGKKESETRTQFEQMQEETQRREEQTVKRLTQNYGFNLGRLGGPLFCPFPVIIPELAAEILLHNATTEAEIQAEVDRIISTLAEQGATTAGTQEAGSDLGRIVERDIRTALADISRKFEDAAADLLDTDIYEVTAHWGARDKDGPNPWSNHERWQGRLYSKTSRGGYPSIYEVCGLDEVDGLLGINCRHGYRAFIPGLMQRMYSEQELAEMKWKKPREYAGREYSYYEATQALRRAEHKARTLQRQAAAERAAGLTAKAELHEARRRAVAEEYDRFIKALDLKREERGL